MSNKNRVKLSVEAESKEALILSLNRVITQLREEVISSDDGTVKWELWQEVKP